MTSGKFRMAALGAASLVGLAAVHAGCGSTAAAGPSVVSAEFTAMSPPSTIEQKSDVYTQAKVTLTYSDGTTRTHDLAYHKIFDTTDVVGGNVVGGFFDAAGNPIVDASGQLASDAPDGTSLIQVPGLAVPGATGNPLALIHQFEYKALPPAGATGDFWSKLPSAMGLTLVDQDRTSGLLTAKSYRNVSFAGVSGGWIHCGSTLSSWNTHVGSEEYEPDAKVRGGGAKASGSDDATDIHSFSSYYFGSAATANPYRYGLVPEVTVAANGTASVVKHHAPGRYAREMQIAASDEITSIGGDDGKNTGLFMFVADRARDLSAGTIYAAKVTQAQLDPAAGNAITNFRYDIQWIRLGHATDAEVKALVDGGITFAQIFDASSTDPADASYRKVITYTGTEWLRLKPGMEKAAAFLETRRYAAYLGATTEFSKMEYIAFNRTDRKFYLVISRIEAGMIDAAGDIHDVARNDGGVILEMATAAGVKDSAGAEIASAFAGKTLVAIPHLVGGWSSTKDAEGNSCTHDRICGPDNIVYVDSIRTLFIGEDTSRRATNYVWAYNVDTRKLSLILSIPLYAEATGLSVVENYDGHAYVMSNFQHPGDGSFYTGADAAAVMTAIDAKWGNRKKAALGYIGTTTGALPAFR